MTEFHYHGDDACPKCCAIYSANCLEQITQPDTHVTCMDCGYVATIKEFVDKFNELHPEFCDDQGS